MKTIVTTLVLFFFISISDAQIFGSNDVCPANLYSYSSTIPGAVTYSWTFPAGWYDITGQGTGAVSAVCNVSVGDIYCEGIDAAGNSIATLVLVTQFGGGAAVGWDVQPQNSNSCVGNPYALNIVPNGSGGGSCTNGCGGGIPVSNIAFAVYDDIWPAGNFIGFADGSSLPVTGGTGSYTFYIYNVDYTNGTSTSQAVRIEGGCGTASINNIAQLYIPFPTMPGFSQTPNPVCIGDTVTIYASFNNGAFAPIMGITILNQSFGSMTAIVNSMPARAQYTGTDFNGCTVTETCYINICAPTQLSGDSIVCAGYTYSYSANIPGAVSYQWSFPTGWYGITGQGTANVSATCNLNDGWVFVSGHDASGANVGAQQLQTYFGGGGFNGWDVQPPIAQGCTGLPFSVSVVPNGTGGGAGCSPGCGNGTLHPNIAYAIYTNIWPNGNFLGFADGGIMYYGGFGGQAYVYLVDVTNGLDPPQAIRIEGGCGSGIVNNTIIINPLMPIPPNVIQSPLPACIGDTIQLTEVTGVQNPGWGFMNGSHDIQLLSSQYSNPLIAVVTGNNPYTDLTAIDFNGCPTGIPFIQVVLGNCATIPVVQFASSDTVFCDKQSIDFSDLSTNNPTSWQWTFTGASPLSSTDQHPQGIYYPSNGSFDVTLIACNAAGCDTLHLVNFIVEHISPVASISQSNDTLYVTPATTYQWYEIDSGLVAGATNSFFVPTQAGNYYCIIVDSVGCSGYSSAIAINTGILNIVGNWQLAISPNPNDGNFLIALDSDLPIHNLQMEIMNVLGKTVFINNYSNVGSTFKKWVNLSTMPKGVYYLKVSDGEKAFSKKIILQ